uniref:Uncharacterized protein n=1 Tax=Romanomermis culicivorax TaxID=13658 RepID=A0A915HW09_ROMCU
MSGLEYIAQLNKTVIRTESNSAKSFPNRKFTKHLICFLCCLSLRSIMNSANRAAISTALFASATRSKKFLLAADVNLTFISARQKAHGEMYMPKKLYRMRGPSKNNRHIVPVFRNIRGRTWLKLDLPVLDTYQMKKMQEENYEDFFRSRMKMYGIDPTRPTTRQTKYFLGCS